MRTRNLAPCGRGRSHRRRFGLVTAIGAVTLVFAAGCRERSTVPRLPPVKKTANTPEGKFERVMDRLELVLKDAQAAQGSGVVSERNCSGRLIPPTADEPNYTAEVTIRTVAAVAPAEDAAKPPQNGAAANRAAAKEGAAATGLMTDQAARPLFKSDVYTLLYANDRWQITEPPESPIARTCFEFALSE